MGRQPHGLKEGGRDRAPWYRPVEAAAAEALLGAAKPGAAMSALVARVVDDIVLAGRSGSGLSDLNRWNIVGFSRVLGDLEDAHRQELESGPTDEDEQRGAVHDSYSCGDEQGLENMSEEDKPMWRAFDARMAAQEELLDELAARVLARVRRLSKLPPPEAASPRTGRRGQPRRRRHTARTRRRAAARAPDLPRPGRAQPEPALAAPAAFRCELAGKGGGQRGTSLRRGDLLWSWRAYNPLCEESRALLCEALRAPLCEADRGA
jgi:hypothetical protein